MADCDVKNVGLLVFVISVLVWLITITAVFQVKISDTAGDIGITFIPFIDQL